MKRWVRFVPIFRDDLRPVTRDWVDGPAFWVGEVGVMDEGTYEGQRMWMPLDSSVMPGVGWLPDCDLTDA